MSYMMYVYVYVHMYVACRNKYPALALFLFLLYSNVFANKLRRPFAKKKLEHGKGMTCRPNAQKTSTCVFGQISNTNQLEWIEYGGYRFTRGCTHVLHDYMVHVHTFYMEYGDQIKISVLSRSQKNMNTPWRTRCTYCANFFILKKHKILSYYTGS